MNKKSPAPPRGRAREGKFSSRSRNLVITTTELFSSGFTQSTAFQETTVPRTESHRLSLASARD